MVAFPDAPVTQLVIVDDNGNEVINIGPGSQIVVKGTTYFWSVEISDNNEPIMQWGFVSEIDTVGGRFLQYFDDNGVGDDSLVTRNNSGHTWLTVWDTDIVMYSDVVVSPAGARSVVFNSGTGYLFLSDDTNGNPNNGLVGWVNLAYQNGWTTRGGFFPLSYKRMPDGTVKLRGGMNTGTVANGTVVANIPAGHRPSANVLVPIVAAPRNAGTPTPSFQINTNGNIQVFDATVATTASIDASYSLV